MSEESVEKDTNAIVTVKELAVNIDDKGSLTASCELSVHPESPKGTIGLDFFDTLLELLLLPLEESKRKEVIRKIKEDDVPKE